MGKKKSSLVTCCFRTLEEKHNNNSFVLAASNTVILWNLPITLCAQKEQPRLTQTGPQRNPLKVPEVSSSGQMSLYLTSESRRRPGWHMIDGVPACAANQHSRSPDSPSPHLWLDGNMTTPVSHLRGGSARLPVAPVRWRELCATLENVPRVTDQRGLLSWWVKGRLQLNNPALMHYCGVLCQLYFCKTWLNFTF